VRRGDLYAQAWLNAVAKQVIRQQRTEAENAIVEAYKAKRWEELDTMKPRDNTKGMRSHDHGAIHQGYQDGKKVSFHQGVNGSRHAQIGEVAS